MIQAEGRMRFRQATMADGAMLLRWRNDPITRHASFSQQSIDLTCHNVWLMQTLESLYTNLQICIYDCYPVGVMRTEWRKSGGRCELHWTVAPEWRGQGIGSRMLRKILREAPIGVECIARIKPDNDASKRVATKAGMTEYSPGRWIWINTSH